MTNTNSSRPTLAVLAFFTVALILGIHFTFAAVQGDYGLFRRAEVDVHARMLEEELAMLSNQVSEMENLTHRLSDDYLDLDLLDQQARDILGRLRTDEIVLP